MNPRREFLSLIGASAFALTMRHTVIGNVDALGQSIALLSDTHLHADSQNAYRGFRPAENLATVVQQVVQSDVQAALLCGDAARLDGQLADYERLKEALEPIRKKVPMEIALGNHDDRMNFWKVFEGPGKNALAGKKHVSVLDCGPQRWIVLDSLMFVDKTPGFLGHEQRDWLDQQLANDATRPIIVMVHHTLGERDGDLLDTDRLMRVVKKHAHVKAIVFGHSHQWRTEQHEGVWMINLPAIGYNFADDQPVGWVRADLTATEIKLTLNAIGGNMAEDQKTRTVSWS
jgi:3',5'-cyclic-AMP phosphodiesterase